MASLKRALAKEIFQILKGSGRSMSLFDEHGNKIFEPQEAVSFFAEPDKLMVNLTFVGSQSTLNLYVSQSTNVTEIRKLIDTLRTTATRYNILFNVRKYGKDLSPKDFAFRNLPMLESMWGSSKTSYQSVGKTKLIIRHSERISEESRGARSRKIESIFIETKQGERFLLPFRNLTGARALANHVSSGGSTTDEFANYIAFECKKQDSILAARKHLKGLKTLNEVQVELDELLAALQRTLKTNITRSNGKRTYSNILGNLEDQNKIGPRQAEIETEADRLRNILQLDSESELQNDIPVVAIAFLENNNMDESLFESGEDQVFVTYGFSTEEACDTFFGALVDEYELTQGVDFTCEGDGSFEVRVITDEAKAAAVDYFDIVGSEKTDVTIEESTGDKFLTYATQWVKERFVAANMDAREIEAADLSKQAADLADGLKRIVSGQIKVTVRGRIPSFRDADSAIGFKLAKVLSTGGVNDVTFNYLSSLSAKLEDGKPMSANERFFATRAAKIVDDVLVKDGTVSKELSELDEWAEQFAESNILETNTEESQVDAIENAFKESLVDIADIRLLDDPKFDDMDMFELQHTLSQETIPSMVRYLKNIDVSELELLDDSKHYLSKINDQVPAVRFVWLYLKFLQDSVQSSTADEEVSSYDELKKSAVRNLPRYADAITVEGEDLRKAIYAKASK